MRFLLRTFFLYKKTMRRPPNLVLHTRFYLIGVILTLMTLISFEILLNIEKTEIQEKHTADKLWNREAKNPPSNFVKCNKSKRPRDNEIFWRNGFYQYFVNHELNTTNYFLNVYYDDRNMFSYQKPVIRVNLMITVQYNVLLDYQKCLQMDTYMMFWYSESNALSVSCQCKVIFSTRRWEVNLIKYYMSQWECDIPKYNFSKVNSNSDRLPKYVSLTDEECSLKPTTHIKITIPKKPLSLQRIAEEKKVVLMMKSWFGNWTQEFVPYFVSWMEALKIFGIDHIFASKDALYLKDDVTKKVIQYYENTGILSLPKVITNFEEVKEPHTSFSIDQIGTFLSVNDIFYKHMYSYWYFIHADIDELIVPKIKSRYSSTLSHILEKYLEKQNSASIAAPMSLFYMNYKDPSNTFSQKFPLFEKNYRQPVETMLIDGKVHLDAPKSFINPRTCLVVGIHYCYFTYFDKFKKVEMDIPDDVLTVHHYRRSCKKYPEECVADAQKRFKDNYLYRTIGNDLQNNVEEVLRAVGYNRNV